MKGGRITIEQKSTLTYGGVIVAVLLTAGAIYFFVLLQKQKHDTFGFDPNRPIPSDAVLKTRLKAEEYNVVRRGASETPFQNQYWNNERVGIYVDVIDGQPLFTSLDKYDSGPGGLGVPSFSKPISYDIVVEKPDNSCACLRGSWSRPRYPNIRYLGATGPVRFAQCELEVRNQVRTDQTYKAAAPGRNVSSAGFAGLTGAKGRLLRLGSLVALGLTFPRNPWAMPEAST